MFSESAVGSSGGAKVMSMARVTALASHPMPAVNRGRLWMASS